MLFSGPARSHRPASHIAFAAAALTLAGTNALAQLAITSFTVDCGGQVSTAGTLRLTSTIGQPDAGGAFASGALVMKGGFLTPGVCPADFNASGTVNVQDIFDFLAAWFASAPSADFNGQNGIGVQDIFDFLASWFSGC